jgi:alkylhydroperoxidase/carboxymuconolactone decarboxylase family protein YurZ
MSLLKSISKEEASGAVDAVYKMMEERVGFIPNVVKMHTASPELFEKFMGLVGYYTDHPSLDPVIVSYVRFLISSMESTTYCMKLQSAVLMNYKIPQEDLSAAGKNYHKVNLDPKRKELVIFVLDLMYGKLKNTKERIARLKELGWSEKEIYEMSMLAAIQKGVVQVIKAFEVQPDF